MKTSLLRRISSLLGPIRPIGPASPAPSALPAPVAAVTAPVQKVLIQAPRSKLSDFSQWLGISPVSPERARTIVQGAIGGDLQSQWELFSCMEDSWYRLAKNLNSVKNIVKRMAWNVAPYLPPGQEDPTPQASERSDLVKLAIKNWSPTPGTFEASFEDCLYHALDAFSKGLSVQELYWDQRQTTLGRVYLPRASQLVSQRLYGWNDTGTELGMRGSAGWEQFPRGRVLVSQWHAHSAAPGATALIRPLVPYWVGRTYGWQWLLNNAQIFGVPFRWATYDPAQPGIETKLADMLENLGSAGWAAFPAGTSLEFKEAVTNATNNPQALVQQLADTACDILILGQTLTTEAADRGTQALGTVHESIRREVLQSAAWWVADLLNYQLIPYVLEWNYGDTSDAPSVSPDLSTEPDPLLMAQRDEILQRMGVPLPISYMRDRHQIPEPDPEDPILTPPAPANPFGPIGPISPASPIGPSAKPITDPSPPGPISPVSPVSPISAAASTAASAYDPSAQVAERRRVALGAAYRGAMAPFREAILASSDPDDALRRLQALYADWAPARLETELESALQLCAAVGASLGKSPVPR